MAKAEHVARLSEGPAVWNAWREKQPDVIPDLTRLNLALNQRQFGPSRGGPIDLHGANLEGAMLRFATLTGANLESARLVAADLMNARLDRALLEGADLTDAILDNADLTDARLDGAMLTGASLQNVRNLRQEQIQRAYGDATTTLPAAITPPWHWFPVMEDNEETSEFFGYTGVDQPDHYDAYTLLGLKPSASPREVRAAYRNMVKKLHPDLHPGDRAAELKFQQVNDAYQLLREMAEQAARERQRSKKNQLLGIAAGLGVALVAGGATFYWLHVPPSGSVSQQSISTAAVSTTQTQQAEQDLAQEAEPVVVSTSAGDAADEPSPVNTASIGRDVGAATEQEPESASAKPVADGATVAEPAVNSNARRVDAFDQDIAVKQTSSVASLTKPVEEQQAVAASQAEWRELRNSNNLVALHDFIQRHSGEPTANEARDRLRGLIAEITDPAQLAEFVKNTDGQDDSEIKFARERVMKLVIGEVITADQALWASAVKKGTKSAYEVYLRNHPQGLHAAEARARISAVKETFRKDDEIAWAKARKTNTREAYAEYLETNPRGYFVKEAQKKLAELPTVKPKPKPPAEFDPFKERASGF